MISNWVDLCFPLFKDFVFTSGTNWKIQINLVGQNHFNLGFILTYNIIRTILLITRIFATLHSMKTWPHLVLPSSLIVYLLSMLKLN